MNNPALMDPRLFVPIKVNEKMFQALVDTGSTKTFVGKTLRQEFKEMELPMREYEKTIYLANNNLVITTEHYHVTLYLDDKPFTGEITYLPRLEEDALLGMDLLGEVGIKIFMEGRQVTGRKEPVGSAEVNVPSSTVPEDSVPWYSGVPKRFEKNVSTQPKDPFKGITLRGKKHHRAFNIYRPWGTISVRMNRKGDKASLKWRNMKKTINIPK